MISNSILSQIQVAETLQSSLQEKFGLKVNPFPKSGIANVKDSDEIVNQLAPVDSDVQQKITSFLVDMVAHNASGNLDQYQSLILRGEYGTGKTHTLMFIQFLCKNLGIDTCRPYVVYIDNPGLRLSELIGSVLSQIGMENFRRYLWQRFLKYMEDVDKEESRARYLILMDAINQAHPLPTRSLFTDDTLLPMSWEKCSSVSYKYLLDSMFKDKPMQIQKAAITLFKRYLVNYFTSTFESASVAEYFYDIVTDNINVTRAWDVLTSGDVKNMDKREVHLLKAIVNIVKEQLGMTDFIILIDEFEEIATGRLKETELDNYLRNLRLLIDREKNWCSVFAMNVKAMQQIERVSPPLASRIGDRIIDLKPFSLDSLKNVVANYLKIARVKDGMENSIYPFDESALRAMLDTEDPTLKGSPRFILKNCYQILQRAAEKLNVGEVITDAFVKQEMSGLRNG